MIYAQILGGVVLNIINLSNGSLASTFAVGFDYCLRIDTVSPQPGVGWSYNVGSNTYTAPAAALFFDRAGYDEQIAIGTNQSGPSTQTMPVDSGFGGATMYYTVGRNKLDVYLNGQHIEINQDWTEVGQPGTLSNQIIILGNLVPLDAIEIKIRK